MPGGRHFSPLPRQALTCPWRKKSRNSRSGSGTNYIWCAVRSLGLSVVLQAAVAAPAVVSTPAMIAAPATVATPSTVTRPARTPSGRIIPWAVAVIITWRWDYSYRRDHRDRRGHYCHWWRRYYDRRRGNRDGRRWHSYPYAHANGCLRGHDRRE